MDPVVTQLRAAARRREGRRAVLQGNPLRRSTVRRPTGSPRPQPAPAWDGVRDALEYGPTCPGRPTPAPSSCCCPSR